MSEANPQEFNAQEYRDESAWMLKATPKAERRNLLRAWKMDRDYYYHEARDKHQWDRLKFIDRRRLEVAVGNSDSTSSLEESIQQIDIILKNKNYGHDHREHLMKRLKLSKFFGNSDLIPEIGNLKQKYIEFAQSEGIETNGAISKEKYIEYLMSNYTSLDLTDDELAQVATKLPVEVFASVDRDIEVPVLIANSIQGVRTRFSCSGHDDGGHFYDLKSYYSNAYFGMTFDESISLKDLNFSELAYLDDEVIIKVDDEEGDEVGHEPWIGIYFNQFPSQEWIEKNHKRTPEQILQDTDSVHLEKALGLSAGTLNSEDRDDSQEVMQTLEKKLGEFYRKNPDKVLKPKAFNRPHLASLLKFDYIHEMHTEYEEYYKSPEAKAKRDIFIKLLTEKLLKIRESRKKS